MTATRSAEETFQKASSCASERCPVLLVCGGDGTVSAAANGLAGSVTALGVVPAGRGNDFARALGLYGSPETVAERLAPLAKGDAPSRSVDLGVVGSRYFCTVATFGVDSEVSRRVHERSPSTPRSATYLVAAISELLRYEPRHVRLSGDFGVLERDVLLCATANTPNYGGWYRIAPGARLDDGAFHVCVIRGISRLRALALIPRAMRGTHLRHPAVEVVVTSSLSLDTTEPFPVYADGELLAQTPCRIVIAPRALRVLAAVSV
jgi:diacylglycerol kinase (ATP)